MSTTRSQSSYLLAIIIALIFISVSLSADDLRGAGHTVPAYIDLEFSEQHVNEPDGSMVINIIRSGDYRQTTTVDFQTSEVEASEGRDYKGAGGTITFQPGEGFKTVVLDIIADDQAEQSESFRFEVSAAGPNCVVSRGSAVIWIHDTAAALSEPVLEITPAANNSFLLAWESSRSCSLERSLDPAFGYWEPVDCNPDVSGNRYQVVHPADGPIYFFRLRTE
jgi:hypothetical protein